MSKRIISKQQDEKLEDSNEVYVKLSKRANKLQDNLAQLESEIDADLTKTAKDLSTGFNRILELWGKGLDAHKDFQQVYAMFTGYPAWLASLIKNDNWQKNFDARSAIDDLDLVHKFASRKLSQWAFDQGLDGALIEVSGEHCRKYLIENPCLWLKGNDGRWPYCLDNTTNIIPAVDYEHIKEANVLLLQLQQSANNAIAAKTPSKKRRITQEEANLKALEFLKSQKYRTVRTLANAIGCSEGLIGRLPAWQAYQSELEKQGLKKPSAPKAVSLTDGILANEGRNDPELERLIDEQAEDDEADQRQYPRHKKV